MRLQSWLALALLVAHAQAASSQPVQSSAPSTDAAPWHVSFIDGPATLTRDGLTEELVEAQPLVEGDRLQTRPGRIELRAADGALLVLDRDTRVDIVASNVVRLLDGRVRIITDAGQDPSQGAWQVLSPVASILLDEPGEFDLALAQQPGEPQIVVSVLRGRARVESLRGNLDVTGGLRAVARDLDVPRFTNEPFDWQDGFSLWVAGRLESWTPTTNARYLPEPLNGYSATLDEYGSWEPYRDAGIDTYVWFPRVDVGWRPYTTGRWSRVGRFGWTWIGRDSWAWPTHHYGRWGYTSYGRWYWMPGPSWGPAWVEWAIGPGYVGWCPLGWDNRPVFSFSLFNDFDDWGYRGYSRPGYNSWTFLASQRFHRGDRVWQHALDARRLPRDDRRAFVTQRTPPPSRQSGYAIPRASASSRPGSWGSDARGSERVGSTTPRGDRTDAGRRQTPWAGTSPGLGSRGSAAVPRSPAAARGTGGRDTSPDTRGPGSRDRTGVGVPRSPSDARGSSGAYSAQVPRGLGSRDRTGVAAPRSPSGTRDDSGRYLPQAPRQSSPSGRTWQTPRSDAPGYIGRSPGNVPSDRPQRVPPEVRQRSPYEAAPAERDSRGGSAGYRVAPRGGDSGARDRGAAPQSRPSPRAGAPGGGASRSPASRSPSTSSGSSRGGSSRGSAVPRSPRSRP